MTRAIFFDAAGTLFHLPRGVGWHYREVARRHGAELDEAALTAAFRAVWKEAPPPHETRTMRADDDRGWWQELVVRVLDKISAGPGLNREAYFAELWSEFTKPGVWELYPETREVLSSLHGRYRLGVISNFDGRLRQILPQLGIAEFFDDVVISSEVGAEKPSSHIFAEALRRLLVEAAEALHVGDEAEADWRGAAAAGLRVFELERPKNSLSDLLALF